MRRTLPTTLTDYVFWLINPMLIMLLLDSFTFYLLEAHYDGENKLRLTWAFLCFNMGIVACARISLMQGATPAEFLAVPLIGATIFVMWALTSAPLLATLLVFVLCFLAFRIAKNTTILDEAEEASSRGLVGRFFAGGPRASAETPPAKTQLEEENDGPATPVARLRDHLRGKRPPETPGLWILYVTPLTLLAMGLSSWFLPEGSRTYAHFLLATHLGCALILLATSTFLNLRRYLRQRQIQMPETMTGVWVASAGAMLAAVLLAAMILPRPGLVEPLQSDLLAGGWWDRQADWSFPWDGTEGDETDTRAPDGDGEPRDEPSGESGGEANPRDSESPSGSGGGQEQGQSGPGGEPQPASDGDASSGASGESGDSSSESGSTGSSGGESGSGEQGPSDQGESGGAQSSQGQGGEASANQGTSGQPTERQPSPESSNASGPTGDPFDDIIREQAEHYRENQERVERHINWQKLLANLWQIVLYLFWLAIFLATVWLVWRYRAPIYAAFAQWWNDLQAWFARMFRWGDPRLAAAGEAAVAATPPRPFHAFADPFRSGMAARWNLRDLLAYSQEALDAWSRDRAFPRGAGETPGEFAARLALRDPATRGSVVPFADVYARAAFAPDGPPNETVQVVRSLWAYLSQSAGNFDATPTPGTPAQPRRPVLPPPPPIG